MMPEVRRRSETLPFKPFAVRMSDGREYAVPTADHAKLNPRGTCLVVFSDDDSHATISALHLVAVIENVAA